MVSQGGVDEKNGMAEDGDYIIRMRGLPWAVTVEEILKFLSECRIKHGREGVHLTMSREGRPSGEAFIELETPEDLEKALKKDRDHIGHRYIEIFKTTRADMEWIVDRSGLNMENVMDECCVRLRGLPFGCTKEDVSNFFSGLAIVSNGITFVSDSNGRHTGEAYVQFVNKEMVEAALKKHLERIGHRYIEIFRSSLAEVRTQTGPKIRPLMAETVSRPMPYDRNDRLGGMNRYGSRGPPPRSRGGYDDDWDAPPSYRGGPGGRPISPPPAMRIRNALYDNGGAGGPMGGGGGSWKRDQQSGFMVHMRGLPYRATEQDIATFFRPLEPVDIRLLYERSGLPSGEADVEFATYEEAQEAMQKDKANMKNRYIELFLSTPPPAGGGRKRGPPPRAAPEPEIDTSLFSRRGLGTGPPPSVGGATYYSTTSVGYKPTPSSGVPTPVPPPAGMMDGGHGFGVPPSDYRGGGSLGGFMR